MALLIGVALVFASDAQPAAANRTTPRLDVDKETYRSGQEVRVQGKRFDRKDQIDFKITGLNGSCKEDEVVAEGAIRANRKGDLDMILYMVQWDDCGKYEVTAIAGRNEARPVTFKVDGPAKRPPDGTLADLLSQ